MRPSGWPGCSCPKWHRPGSWRRDPLAAAPAEPAPPTGDASVDRRTLPRLRAFLAVADEQSFTRAAARRLERELGAWLFERTTREARRTPAGEAMLDAAWRALGELALELPDAELALELHLYDDPSAGLRTGTSDVALLAGSSRQAQARSKARLCHLES